MKLYYLSELQAETLLHWWHALNPTTDTPYSGFNVGRKDRAELCRAQSFASVPLHSAFVQLAAKLAQQTRYSWQQTDSSVFVLLAGLLPMVRDVTQDGQSWAFHAGQSHNDRPMVSMLRFEQIQRCQSEDELFLSMRRVLQQLNRPLDIVVLAEELLAWVAEHRLHHTVPARFVIRARWANDYYRRLNKLAPSPDNLNQDCQGETA